MSDDAARYKEAMRRVAMGMPRKVVAGPVGHWYALDGEILLAKPMWKGEIIPPPHPSDKPHEEWGEVGPDEWAEIAYADPKADREALIAALSA